ncbi:MAG TPA: glycosyltransferase family 4 protein [Croceibacterium sp.]|nr:glycosyltransferase family 4 protein [Croceibacterium sp.]
MTDPLAQMSGQPLWVMAKGYAPDEGGMQTYAQGVAEAWAGAGAQVTVFTQTSLGPRRERIGDISLIDIGPGKSPTVPLRFLRAMRAERRASGAPHFVHGTTWRTAMLPMVMGLPYAVTFHGREFMADGIARRAVQAVARRAKAVVAVSHYTRQRLLQRLAGAGPDPIVAWNGLSTPPPSSTPAPGGDVPLLFSLCRLEPRKNVAAAVRACAALHREGFAFRYVIGGRGPELARIGALVNELGLADVVEVAGFLDSSRVTELHARARIFLHPQVEVEDGRDFEGFGITIADAMAAQTAVIVGDSGGTPELIEQGVTGLIVDGTRDDDVTEALRSLLTDSARCEAMAAAAHDHALKTFRWDRHVRLIAAAVSG